VVACSFALLLAIPVIATSDPESARADVAGSSAVGGGRAGPPAPEFAPVPMRLAVPEPAAPPAPRTGLARAAVAAAEAAAAASTELGVAVLDRATGETVIGGRGSEPYYTASLSKVVVIADLLDRRRLEAISVSDADIALIRRALGPSDDSAMNALWSRFDGAGAAGRLSARLGLTGTTAPRDASQWGEMSVPAADTVRIWEHILDDMPAADRQLMITAMDSAPARATDGFNQAFGLLSPQVDGPDGPGAVAKQGWMCCFSGEYYLHSTGAVGADRRFLVALLTRVPRGPGWESARSEVTGIAAAAAQAVS
jgi:hypothetical protein